MLKGRVRIVSESDASARALEKFADGCAEFVQLLDRQSCSAIVV